MWMKSVLWSEICTKILTHRLTDRQSTNTEPYEGNTQRYTTYSICVTKCTGDLAVEPLDLCIFV